MSESENMNNSPYHAQDRPPESGESSDRLPMPLPNPSTYTLPVLMLMMLVLSVALALAGNTTSEPGLLRSIAWMIGGTTVVCYILMILVRKSSDATGEDPASLVTIARCETDFEATAIVTRLMEEGVYSKAVGGHTSGFQVEAPGTVQVVVRKIEHRHAEKILDQIRLEAKQKP